MAGPRAWNDPTYDVAVVAPDSMRAVVVAARLRRLGVVCETYLHRP